MFNAPAASTGKASAFDGVLSTALYLQQWDIPVPSTSSAIGNLFKSLQSFNTLEDKDQLIKILDGCLLGVLDHLLEENQAVDSLRLSMRTLGILTELDEILASSSHDQVKEAWGRMLKRGSWLKFERSAPCLPV
jgi:ataxia telangiectasia mutated family protein